MTSIKAYIHNVISNNNNVIPRLDRGIQKTLDCPVKPDNDKLLKTSGVEYRYFQSEKIIYLFLIMFLLLPFGGCGKEQPPAKKPMAEQVKPIEVKQETKAAEEAKQVVPEEYKYDAKGRRDPFFSLMEITKQKPLKKKGATPFESYELDEIQLMAIAWDKIRYYALIMLPDRKAYTITEGMTLGLMGGKVEKITKDTVVIREFIKDYKGEIKPRDSILKLHKGEEE